MEQQLQALQIFDKKIFLMLVCINSYQSYAGGVSFMLQKTGFYHIYHKYKDSLFLANSIR